MFNEKHYLKTVILILSVIIIILLTGLVFMYSKNPIGFVDQQKISAVFLTDGQVYFGNLSKKNSDFVILENIYYIKMQPAEQEEQQSEIQLIKLGNEIHGPEDKMEINKDHVLYIEKLKSDSQVIQMINNYSVDQ